MWNMDNGQRSDEQPRKRRGRPPGAQKAPSASAHLPAEQHVLQDEVLANGSTTVLVEQKPRGDQQQHTATEVKPSPLSQLLRTILQHDRAEITRIAKEIDVAEN